MNAPAVDRILTLDIVRGVAVMGILAMNIVAFAMPFEAYMNPNVYGLEGPADLASWAFNFVFVDGKMRGLFSFLFGASTLLVIERAEAAGRSPARIHYVRMLWMLVLGLIHFYLIWFGDILVLYSLVGLLLYSVHRQPLKSLMIAGVALVLVQSLMMGLFGMAATGLAVMAASPNPDPAMVEQWQFMQEGLAPLTAQQLAENLALHRGSWIGLVEHRLIENGFKPFASFAFAGFETLGYMVLGMAALKSGFLRGAWPAARYRKWALICLAIAVPVYALLAWALISREFAPEMVIALSLGATTPFRPLMIVAYAALIVLATRGGGTFVARIAAAGRAAFSNYLGTSILMTTLFYGYGFGLYGTMSRAELWLVVVAMWALMLLWSKPWLDRYRYGPFEWLWRSLARWELQLMRKAAPASS